MLFIILLLFITVDISKCLSYENEEKLRQYVRQGLDMVAQDVLAVQNARILHDYKFNSGIGNREELVVQNIILDENFEVGQNITEWQTINFQEKYLAFGQTSFGFVMIISIPDKNSPNGFNMTKKIIELKAKPTAFTLYKRWNFDKMKYEVYLLATFIKTFYLQSFLVTEDFDLETALWMEMQQRVTHLKMFQCGEVTKLLVINEKHVNSDATTADVYDVFIDKKFQLGKSHRLLIDCSASSSAINIVNSEIYLSIPQQISNTVRIYKYSNEKFIPYKTIISKNVAFVKDFTIGYRSYLAIGGYNSAIFRITNSELVKEVINIHLEEVTCFLPIPIKSYRDEVLLLVQDHIDYQSHVAPIIKVLIYSKGEFHAHDEMPCDVMGHSTHGADCMADVEHDLGILGSATLITDDIAAVIVPKYEDDARLFIFNWKLIEVVNPIVQKVDKIIKTRIKIQKILEEQQKEIYEIQRRLVNSLKSSRDNEITGNWKINTIISPNVIYENPKNLNEGSENYAENFRPYSMESDFKMVSDEIDSLQGKILNIRSATISENYVFENLKINGNLEVTGTSNIKNVFVSKVNDEIFDDFIEDCVKRSEKTNIKGTKILKKVETDNINFEKISNKSFDNIALFTDQTLKVKGDLMFNSILQIKENVNLPEEGLINNMKLQNELVYMNSFNLYPKLKFKNINVNSITQVESINNKNISDLIRYDNVNYDGLKIQEEYLDLSNINLNTEHINNKQFLKFVNNMCLKNIECSLKNNLTIKGKLRIIKSADIKNLNGLKYPEEYLISKEMKMITKISGKKKFFGNVSTTEIDMDGGLIDSINPDEIITLSAKQSISDNFTFADLEVTESFRVDGDILVGPKLTKFIPNPTLQDSNIIENNVLFKSLEVDGLIVVNNLFNTTTVKDIFADVVYTDEDIVQINSDKKITEEILIENNLNIETNKINNVNIKELITLNSAQTIKSNIITGKVKIENLEVTGLLNNENINKHFSELIRIDKEEIIDSEIIFKNKDDDPDLIAKDININFLNGMKIFDFMLTTGDRSFKDTMFKFLKAEKVEFKQDVNYEIECFDIDDYAKNRFSLTKDQNITAKMKIVNGTITNIKTEFINDIEWEFIKHFLNINEIFYKKFINGDFRIGELIVDKSLNVELLNDKNLNTIFRNAFWKNKVNNISSEIIFKDEVQFKNLQINKLNGVKFNEFLNEIVKKNETNIVLFGNKIFNNGFTVESSIKTDKINEMNIENILMGSTIQEIQGNLIVHGDVWVHEDLNVRKYVDEIPVKYIKNKINFHNNAFILKGNVTFKNDVTIDNLHVNGNSNGVHPTEYLQNIVRIHDDVMIKGTTVFKRNVRILKNLKVETTIDGVNINKMMDSVVLISSDDFIQGIVTFTENVEVLDTVELETDLDTKILCGCDVSQWINKAVIIGDGRIERPLKFENVSVLTNLNVDILNGVDLALIIPLHTDQVINKTLNLGFLQIENDLEVGGLVNGHNLLEEFENTVLINTDQEITSKLIITNPVKIKHNLKTFGLVNDQDLQRLVTTNTDQNLTASYVFNGKVTVDSNFYTTGTVNKINFTDWKLRTVTANSKEEQNINDLWIIEGDVNFGKNVIGEGHFGGIEVKRLANEVTMKQREKFHFENLIKADYYNICSNVQDLVKIGKSRPYFFKYLEFRDKLEINNDVSTLHYFKIEGRNYLIIGQEHKCESLLYEWIPNSFQYITNLKTGDVEQFITVYNNNKVFLVTKNRNNSSCTDKTVNIWIFSENTLTHMYGMNHSVILKKSKLPGTFYCLDDTNQTVTVYKISYENNNPVLQEYKQWNQSELLKTDNFVNNGVLELEDAQKLGTYGYEVPTVIENAKLDMERYYPKINLKELLLIDVGGLTNIKQLTAVAIWEEAVVKSMSDEIKIYENFKEGRLFDKISTYRPSNLNVLHFDESEETFLLFLENYEILKMYQYKGLEGFKHKSSINIEASKMLTISLRLSPYYTERQLLLLINGNTITIIEVVMDGDRLGDNFDCKT